MAHDSRRRRFLLHGPQAEELAASVFPDDATTPLANAQPFEAALFADALIWDVDAAANDPASEDAFERVDVSVPCVAVFRTADVTALTRFVNRWDRTALVRLPAQKEDVRQLVDRFLKRHADQDALTDALRARVAQLEKQLRTDAEQHRIREEQLETELARHASELLEQMERIERFALRDALTQLYNVKYFRSRLKSEFDRARRHQHPLGLLFIDIDSFKRLNDRCGHLFGDKVIQAVAETLSGHESRSSDVACRYGGEEFVVILPETDLGGALAHAERLRVAIEKLTFPEGEPQGVGRITASFGAAAFPECVGNPEDLVRAADDAMLEAKRLGRNRVVASPRTSTP